MGNVRRGRRNGKAEYKLDKEEDPDTWLYITNFGTEIIKT